jgi:hypothetical protein
MIVGHAKPTSVTKYCYQICADGRNASLLTYTYTYNGVSYSGSLEPNTCTTVCADENSVSIDLQGTITPGTECNGLADCSEGGGGDPTPTPTPTPTEPSEGPGDATTYTVTWNFNDTSSLTNAYVGATSTSTSAITTKSVTNITSGSNATTIVYIVPNTGYTYTLSNQASVSVSLGTANNSATTNGAIPVTLTVTNVTNNLSVNVTVSDANGGAVSTDSGSGSGPTPTPTPTTDTSSGSGSGSGTYYYTVQCVSGSCTTGTTRPVTWVGEPLTTGTLVTLDNQLGCWEVKSTTTATPTSTVVGLCSSSPTPTPVPSYKYVVECVSGDCLQGTGRVASSSTAYSAGDVVSLDNVNGCWEVLSSTTATAVSSITGTAGCTPTPTPTVATYTVYKMDPCDGVSPYVYARSTGTVTLGTVYSLTGSTYADQLYTAIQSLTSTTWDTYVADSWGDCDGGDVPTCLLEGTKVTLHDGTQKNIEELVIGDTLLSKVVLGNPNMPDSDDISVLSQWSSESITLSSELTQITAVTGYPRASATYINNGLLKASPSHQHIVKKNGAWTVAVTTDLQVGDSLINENGQEILIESLSEVNGSFIVYKIDVEQNDTFIADGIVTHNGKGV